MGIAPSPRTDRYVHPDAARLAAWTRVYENYLVVDDLYPGLAQRFAERGVSRFVEIGGGRGPIARELAAGGVDTCVVDVDARMVAEAQRPSVRGDLRHLPLAGASVDAVAAVNCLYFLDDPAVGIDEAHRVLRPGGWFVASSPSRWNDPELEGIDQSWGQAGTFDSEDAPALVAHVFGAVEVEAWSIVAYVLPDQAAIANYLHATNVENWREQATRIAPPLNITKVGAQVWARR